LTWMPSFGGVRRNSSPKPLVILMVVDVEQDSFIFYFKVQCLLLVAAEDGPAAYVSFERHDLREDGTVQEDWVAADALICGDHNLRFGTVVLLSELIEGLRADEWLVRQDNEGGVYFGIQS
jgi:hypothetical protein